jgi:hypothetical protein
MFKKTDYRRPMYTSSMYLIPLYLIGVLKNEHLAKIIASNIPTDAIMRRHNIVIVSILHILPLFLSNGGEIQPFVILSGLFGMYYTMSVWPYVLSPIEMAGIIASVLL